MAEPPVRFAGLLRQLRARAGLTQEGLAEAAGLNPRTISDLERGLATTPHKDTVRLLADALRLSSQERIEFERRALAEIAAMGREEFVGRYTSAFAQHSGAGLGRCPSTSSPHPSTAR